MLSYVVGASTALAKRAIEKAGEDGQPPVKVELPWFAWGVFFLDFLVFFPAIILTSYTLGSVVPTLAIVEDANPSPAYEPLSLNEDNEVNNGIGLPSAPKTDDQAPARFATSSLRASMRLLYSVGGWRSYLRGILCAWAVSISTGIVGAIFGAVPFVPHFAGTFLATLALVQLHTVWVHIVISNEMPSVFFWRRLPPFRRTFDATVVPVCIYWGANTLSQVLTYGVAWLTGLQLWGLKDPTELPPQYQPGSIWKHGLVLVVALLSAVLFVVPAKVALVRVQASLLPPDQDTIVSFDRSFGGAVEPAVVGGKGYATAREALSSFTRASWVRLYKIYAKVFAIMTGVYLLMMAVILAEVFLMASTIPR